MAKKIVGLIKLQVPAGKANPSPPIGPALGQRGLNIMTPPTTVLIKKAAGIESGSPKPHTDKVGKITRKQVEEIAKTKMPDLNAADLEAAMRIVAGSARSMGVIVEGM